MNSRGELGAANVGGVNVGGERTRGLLHARQQALRGAGVRIAPSRSFRSLAAHVALQFPVHRLACSLPGRNTSEVATAEVSLYYLENHFQTLTPRGLPKV